MPDPDHDRVVSESLETVRSRYALDEVKRWQGAQRVEATALTQGLPVALRTQGLVVTLARLLSSERRAHGLLARCLTDWLGRDCPIGLLPEQKGPAQLLERLIRMEPMDYLAVQREALALAERLKLLAGALHGGED